MRTPAEVQIHNLIHRYADHIDNARFEQAADLFRRAVVVMGGEETDADGALARWRSVVTLHDGLPRTHHLMHNVIIDFNDDHTAAEVDTKYTVFQGLDGTIRPIITGGYRDAFACENDEWFFTRREYRMGLLGDLSQHLESRAT
ncbi:nuclear transport factor 2 family protein [Enemella sp. A6]|uniref:nuclear transport factor 2 family protein n=1 Tax=Enemella sp. A6 TaxID=3440152 RepID=UPI003EB88794